jgi:hypothetical protein
MEKFKQKVIYFKCKKRIKQKHKDTSKTHTHGENTMSIHTHIGWRIEVPKAESNLEPGAMVTYKIESAIKKIYSKHFVNIGIYLLMFVCVLFYSCF